jgi:hypothetical protein
VGRITERGKCGRWLRRVSDSESPDWYDKSRDPLSTACEYDADNEFARKPTSEYGTPIEQFAKSDHGREIYLLHDEGFALADTQREMIPLQRTVYLTAKQYHDEQAKQNTDTPSTPSSVSRHI